MTANAGTVVVNCPCGNQVSLAVRVEPGETRNQVHHVPVSVDFDEAWQKHTQLFHTAA